MRWHKFYAMVLVCAAVAAFSSTAMATEQVTSIDLDSPSGQTGPFTQHAYITSITAPSGSYPNLLFPSHLGHTQNTSSQIFFRGSADAPVSSVSDVLLDSDITDGVVNPTANGSGVINLFFDEVVQNQTGADLFLFNIDPDSGNTESWSVRPIVGGTPLHPRLGGAAKSFSTSNMGDTGDVVGFSFDGALGGSQSQNNWGIAFDLGSDFGGTAVASAIGFQVSTGSGDPSVIAGVSSGTAAPEVLLGTETTSGTQVLRSVSVRRPGAWGYQTYTPDELIGIDVTHFNGASTSVILSDSSTLVASGERAALIEDNVLNTGLINPGTGSGLSSPPAANEEGMQFTFDVPLVNSAGPDMLLVEIEQLPNTPNSFWLSPVDFSEPGLAAHLYTSADYSDQGPTEAVWVQSVVDPSSLTGVETSEISPNSSQVAGYFNLFAVAIDLSDLGYRTGDRVSSLFLQATGATVDPVFIAGFQAIPEPSSLLLLLFGGAGLLVRRRR